MSLRVRFACCVLLGFAAPAAAQSVFDSWSTEDGLPQNSINDITQTRDGYLWLATFGGLVRFDGIRFVVFDRTTPGVASQRIKCVLEDRSGTLWAATSEGMLIRYRAGEFTTFGVDRGLPVSDPLHLEEDESGHLWLSSTTTVVTFDGERGVGYGSKDFDGRIMAPRTPIASPHEVWWHQDEKGIHAFIRGRVETYAIEAADAGIEVASVNADSLGNLWARTKGAGALQLRYGQARRYTTRDGLPSNSPLGQLYADRRGNIWHSWYSNVNSDRHVFRIKDGVRETVSLSGLGTVFVDREGSTWLGTASIGLHRLREPSITVYSERDGLSWNWVYSILQSKTGEMWIGTWGGGLSRFVDGTFSTFRIAQGLPSDFVTAVYEDRSGRLWVATSNGLSYWENGRFRKFDGAGGLLNGEISAIHEDRRGRLWFGATDGLVRLDRTEHTRFTTGDGLSHNHVMSIFEDRDGALWIGTQRGVAKLVDDRVVDFAGRDMLAGAHIRTFHQDRDGVLWIGTYDSGLFRLHDDRMTRYTKAQGLHDHGVFQILEDESGAFWMGSNRGISRITRQQLEEVAAGRRHSVAATVYGTRDGMSNAETNGGRHPPGWKTPDGRLWFPTMGGVAVIDPARAAPSAPPPNALIEDVQVAARSVDFASTVRLPSSAPTVTIRYTAPSFVKPDLVRFRYRLAGLDEDWTEAGANRVAMFHRIPPGEYTFNVLASSHDGVWNTDGPSVRIVVEPPIWWTWWFISFVITAVMTTAIAAHQLRIRHLRRERDRQADFSGQLIQSQEEERKRLAREMHDGVGQHLAIIRRLARENHERWSGDAAVAQVLEQIAHVADGIDTDVKEIAHGLRPYQLDTIGLTKTLTRMVHRVARVANLECDTDIASLDDLLSPEAQTHVYRIVQESLNNVIKHSLASRVRIAVNVNRSALEITVEDNGNGFRRASADDQSHDRHSFGLMGLQERARILGGQAEITSTPEGTWVRVTAPLEHARE